MSNDKAWDSDAYSPNEYPSVVHIGLSADPSIIRRYVDGKLVSVKTVDAGLPLDTLGELAGIVIVADDIVSMTGEGNLSEIKVCVNERLVTIGEKRLDDGYEWRAFQEGT